MSQKLVAILVLIFLLPLSLFAHTGQISPAFQLKSNPLIRITAAEILLRFPTRQGPHNKDLSADEREHAHRLRYESLLILKGLPGYYGVLNLARDLIKNYEDGVGERAASLAEELVYGWAVAYRTMHGTRGTRFDLMSAEAKQHYDLSLRQMQDLPEGLRQIEQPVLNGAESAWIANQAQQRALAILDKARFNAAKPLSCEAFLQSP